MAKNKLINTEQLQQRAFLVGANVSTREDLLSQDDSMQELEFWLRQQV